VLSRHVLLIAVIFVPYMTFMIGLGVYIWHTGRVPAKEEADRDQEPELPSLPLAA
jgi:hypothetical protein